MCTDPLGVLLKCRLCNSHKLPGDVDTALKSSKVLGGLAWFGASLDLDYHSGRYKQGKSWNISISRLTEGPVFYNLVFYDLSPQSRDCHQVITLSIMCAISHDHIIAGVRRDTVPWSWITAVFQVPACHGNTQPKWKRSLELQKKKTLQINGK